VTTMAGERLAVALGEVTGSGSFSAQCTAPADGLHIEVRGLGQLVLPVSEAQARELCRLGRPARYGRGEQTLVDRGVRDTWEMPTSRVKIDKRRWNKTLLPVLARLRGDLGLAAGCELGAELHSMLVYAPGQFFVPHQDSEKADEMVGSLVVTLPGSFTGGALIIEHGGVTATYRSSKKALSFVAFYADCRHEIRPVRSGYRIVLTYDLLVRGDTAAAAATDASPPVVDALAGCLDEHFTTPLPSPRRVVDAGPADPPNRLVYLLDHEYTARGLSWSRLKGSDAGRAALLRAAAMVADCEIVLGLADVHETWSCIEHEWRRPWSGRRRDGWWDDRDDDDDEDDDYDDARSDEGVSNDTDGYELDELVDWAITVDCWIDPSSGKAEPVATTVDDAEVCVTTPSADLRPYASEYEGYMGNYGNTMDRWYHRGALLVWPRQRAFAVRAEASPTWALDALSTRVRAGDVEGAREMAATLAPFWNTVAGGEERPRVFTKALRVAHSLDHPELAAKLLQPFRLEMVARGHAPTLVALVDRYGERWARDLLAVWSVPAWPQTRSGGQSRPTWVASLARLGEVLSARGATGGSIARLLVRDSWTWASEAVEQRRGLMPPSRRDDALRELARPVLAVLETTAIVGADDVRDHAVRFVCAQSDDVLACLMQVLRAATALPPATRTAAGLDAIAGHCVGRLQARVARPQRATDDWSINLPGGCTCALCHTLGAFLTDPARRAFEWPLAQQGRHHVHSRLDGAELPVRHQTRRTGRPYTLVLTKTEAIFERDNKARQRDEADLAWLHDDWGSSQRPRRRR
jgi:hypothetical protein